MNKCKVCGKYCHDNVCVECASTYKEYTRCRNCGKYFPSENDKAYCSESCSRVLLDESFKKYAGIWRRLAKM